MQICLREEGRVSGCMILKKLLIFLGSHNKIDKTFLPLFRRILTLVTQSVLSHLLWWWCPQSPTTPWPGCRSAGAWRRLIWAPPQTCTALNFTHACLLLAYRMALALGCRLIHYPLKLRCGSPSARPVLLCLESALLSLPCWSSALLHSGYNP